MMIDSQLILVPTSAPLSIVGGAGVAFATPPLDLIGQGVGAPPFNIFGTTALFGTDFGVGKQDMMLQCTVGTAFATSNSATLNVQFQLAVDQGAAGNYQPGTWNTIVETGGIAAASLTANQVIARFDWPPAFPANLRPRYMRINFAVLAATNFTAGTIGFLGLVPMRDDQANKFAAKNFAVA